MEVTQEPWCQGTGGVDPAGVLEPRPCSKGQMCVWQCLITTLKASPNDARKGLREAPASSTLAVAQAVDSLPPAPASQPPRRGSPGRGRGQSSLTSFKAPSSQSGTGWCSWPVTLLAFPKNTLDELGRDGVSTTRQLAATRWR